MGAVGPADGVDMSSATLPPPLSDSPTVETLERLLAGLHQPVQRGVPSPPDAAESLGAGMFEQVTEPAASDGAVVAPPSAPAAATPVAPAPVAPAPVAPAPVAPAPDAAPARDQAGPAALSWSAAHARRGRRMPSATALGVAAVTAAGVVAALVVAGELPLP